MRYFINTIIGIIALFMVGWGVFSLVQKNTSTSPKQQYVAYCAGCHGANLEAFVARSWKYGKSHEAVFASIKYGKSDIGMPAFEEAFNDEQIHKLTSYILRARPMTKSEVGVVEAPVLNKSEELDFMVDTVLSGIEVPWAMEFLPNGEILITERNGNLYRLKNGKLSEPVKGLPDIWVFGQGGLLDIKLHPNYAANKWIYISYAYPSDNPDLNGGSTALMRARLDTVANRLVDAELLFKAEPAVKKGPHFGGRIAFDNQGHVYFSVGDRGTRTDAQLLYNANGKIHRFYDDGVIPPDNPFYNIAGAIKSIWSYGHRNPQGLTLNPETNELWEHEHGPRGGDEINLIEKGLNYGWPAITYGINYNGTIITQDTAMDGMQQPITYYDPSIAPCGMDFVDSDLYPGWKNNILMGSLRFMYLERVVLDGHKVTHHEKLLEGIGRVREVRMSPDGHVYFSIEKPGKILRLVPVNPT